MTLLWLIVWLIAGVHAPWTSHGLTAWGIALIVCVAIDLLGFGSRA